MAGQSIFSRTLLFFNNSSKTILTNRINRVNLTPSAMGFKQDPKELEKYKIPERPKKPLTAFFAFMVDKRPIFEKEHPGLPNTALVKKISEEWKILSTEAKAKYEEHAKRSRVEYDHEILAYEESLTPDQQRVLKELREEQLEEKKRRKIKKESKEEGKPKRPASSFGIFLKEFTQSHREGKSFNEVIKEIKDKWTKLPESEKNIYKAEFEKNRVEYEKNLKAWENRMLAEGKEQLIRVKTLKAHQAKLKCSKKGSKLE